MGQRKWWLRPFDSIAWFIKRISNWLSWLHHKQQCHQLSEHLLTLFRIVSKDIHWSIVIMYDLTLITYYTCVCMWIKFYLVSTTAIFSEHLNVLFTYWWKLQCPHKQISYWCSLLMKLGVNKVPCSCKPDAWWFTTGFPLFLPCACYPWVSPQFVMISSPQVEN